MISSESEQTNAQNIFFLFFVLSFLLIQWIQILNFKMSSEQKKKICFIFILSHSLFVFSEDHIEAPVFRALTICFVHDVIMFNVYHAGFLKRIVFSLYICFDAR